MEQRCARCGGTYTSDYYGLCPDCRGALNERFYKEPVARQAGEAYTPKMNVTPNQVALPAERDDDDVAGT